MVLIVLGLLFKLTYFFLRHCCIYALIKVAQWYAVQEGGATMYHMASLSGQKIKSQNLIHPARGFYP